MVNQASTENTPSNPKSGQKVARQIGPTSEAFWSQRVFLPKTRRNDRQYQSSKYYVRIQHRGIRECFCLQTADKSEAAKQAKAIFCLVNSGDDGWQRAREKYGKAMIVRKDDATIGEYLTAAEEAGLWPPHTFYNYACKLRRLAAEVFKINHRRVGNKYDAHQGGRRKWLEAVNKIPIRELSDESVKVWREDYLRQRGTDPVSRARATHTVDSVIRNCKALFGPRAQEELKAKIRYPSPIPFQAIRPKTKGLSSFRYRSRINAVQLIADARKELRGAGRTEQYKMVLLALGAGLRRMEIDRLLWTSVLEHECKIRIEAHQWFEAKSSYSEADIAVERELIEELKSLRKPGDTFVISSSNPPQNPTGKGYRRYRAQTEFNELCQWLRGKGITASCPLHTLRKEFGKLLTEGWGIYAASTALRHSSITLTATYYAQDTRRIVPSLLGRKSADESVDSGLLLNPDGAVSQPSSGPVLRKVRLTGLN